MTTATAQHICYKCNEVPSVSNGMCASCDEAFWSVPRCRFCGQPESPERGPLTNHPGFLPHVLMHDRCVSETYWGGLD